LIAWLGGVTALACKGWAAVPYVVVLLIFPTVYYITHTFSSYRHPIEPAMFLLATYALVTALEKLNAWFHKRQGANPGV
jgi:hypothetical protein